MKKVFSEKELPIIADQLLKVLAKNHFTDKAQIVAFHGDLGAGKTTLIKTLALKMGVIETVLSPTFVLIKKYPLNWNKKEVQNLIHIDAYRFDRPEELQQLGWDRLAQDRQNLIFIEWPEKVDQLLPKDILHVYLDYSDQKRSISFQE